MQAMERSKPPQDHTSNASVPERIALAPIAFIRSPYKERFGTPRQPTVTEQVLEDRALPATIELIDDPKLDGALEGLAGFDYIWVIAWLHLNRTWSAKVVPPRGPKTPQGLFATRSPNRPNMLALSALRLTGVEGRSLHVLGIDLLDGTPVLDIKPYVPYADAFPDARAGWLDALSQPMTAPDRFERQGE